MKNSPSSLQIQPLTIQRHWAVDGIPVLTADISLPQPVPPTNRALRRIAGFYQLQSRCYLRFCENVLLPRARREYALALQACRPLPSFQAKLDYQITYNANGLFSLYTQSRETAPHLSLSRRGDTWDLKSGYPLAMGDLFPPRTPCRRTLIALAARDIRQRQQAGAGTYLPDWQRRLRQSCSCRSFYLTAEGLTFFLPMYAVTSLPGISTFTLPYGEQGLRQLEEGEG